MRGVGHSRSVRVAVLVSAIALVQGCGGGDTEAETTGGGEAVSQGQALYEANCLACHGEGARGDGPMAGSLPVPPPSILEHLAHHTQAQFIQIIQTGLPPAMPPSALSADEVQLIVDYVWTLVPEAERAGLRAMQQRMEMMGDSGMMMPGMNGMPGMTGMPGMGAPGAAADSAATAAPGTGGQ